MPAGPSLALLARVRRALVGAPERAPGAFPLRRRGDRAGRRLAGRFSEARAQSLHEVDDLAPLLRGGGHRELAAGDLAVERLLDALPHLVLVRLRLERVDGALLDEHPREL